MSAESHDSVSSDSAAKMEVDGRMMVWETFRTADKAIAVTFLLIATPH